MREDWAAAYKAAFAEQDFGAMFDTIRRKFEMGTGAGKAVAPAKAE